MEPRAKKLPCEFGRRLKELRQSANINGEDLSVAAGLSRTHVHCIEVGWIVNPKYETVISLARVLGAKLDYLLAGIGIPPTPEQIRQSYRAATERRESSHGEQLPEGGGTS